MKELFIKIGTILFLFSVVLLVATLMSFVGGVILGLTGVALVGLTWLIGLISISTAKATVLLFVGVGFVLGASPAVPIVLGFWKHNR